MKNSAVQNPWGTCLAFIASVSLVFNLSACKPRFGNDSYLLASQNGFFAGPMPTTAEEMVTFFLRREPRFFDRSFLNESVKYFNQQASYLGNTDEMRRVSLAMFQQWLYLEIYKAMRTEYLLMNYTKALVLSSLSTDQVLANFDRYLPGEIFSHYVSLRATRDRFRVDLAKLTEDAVERQAAKDRIKGMIEGAYLARRVIDAKREFTAARYDKNDQRYEKTMGDLDVWENLIKGQGALMLTDSFERLVTPYYKTETAATSKLNESAVNNFSSHFKSRIESMKSLHDLTNFLLADERLNNPSPGKPTGELWNLGVELAKALDTPSQVSFRARINSAFSGGVSEIRTNLQTILSAHLSRFVNMPTSANIVRFNTKPIENNRSFATWVTEVMREESLHWVINEQYPYLKAGFEPLGDLVKSELQKQSTTRLELYAAMTGLLTVSAAFSKPSWAWLGPKSLRAIQSILFGSEVLISGVLVYQAIGKYYEYRDISRLVRLSAEGIGLASVLQEDAAWSAAKWSFAMAGFTVGFTSLTGYNAFFKDSIPKPSSPDFVKNVGKISSRTWGGKPYDLGVWTSQIRREFTAINEMAITPASKFFGKASTVALYGSYIGSQFMVHLPMVLLDTLHIKGVITKLPAETGKAVLFGTVMGVMGVTVQSNINALALRVIANSFESLGREVPAFWKSNGLDNNWKTDRDVLLQVSAELWDTKRSVLTALASRETLTGLINRPETPEDKKAELQTMIVELDNTITGALRLVLVRWYKRVEFRKINNSIYQDEGFGISADPNFENPQRMTITLTISGKNLSYAVSAVEIEDLLRRRVIPDTLTEGDIGELADVTNEAESSGSGVK